jgi:hypothetical protein
MKRDNSLCNLAGYRVNDPGSILGKGKNVFLFHEVQTAFGPTQPPIQSLRASSSVVVRSGMKLITFLQSELKLRIRGAISLFPHSSSYHGA